MFYRYVRFSTTKEVRNYKDVKCIVISQDAIDTSTADLIINKGIKRVINCMDSIINTKYLEMLEKHGVKICFLKQSVFDLFESEGVLYYGESSIVVGRKCINIIKPKVKTNELYIKDFISNTISYMSREVELIQDITISELEIKTSNTALVISRGFYEREDIKAVRYIIKKFNPMIICVDGGADSAIKLKIMPQLVIGDMDSITQEAIEKCDNFLIHRYLDGRCPGQGKIPNIKNIGYISCFGTSEDAAILYCIKNEVERIYTLGFKLNSRDYIEKGRKGMSSSLLTRLYYGHIIYDIKGLDVGYESNKAKLLIAVALIVALIYGGIILGFGLEVFK